jgi:hypothetical protein
MRRCHRPWPWGISPCPGAIAATWPGVAASRIANDMEPEDGVIWVYGFRDDGVIAFTDFGIENLIDLIKMHKDDPTLLKRGHSAK